MRKDEVKAGFRREPFEPMRIHLKDGIRYDVPFREVAHLLGYGVLVLIGLKPGGVLAKGYDRFPFDKIERIEPLPSRGATRRRKAS